MAKKQKTYNPERAKQIIEELQNSPNGEKEIRAIDFGMPYGQFGEQLDGMADHDLICRSPGIYPFSMLIVSDDTKVLVMIGHAAKKFLNEC